MTRTHEYRLGYRSDIEGLRAIAILLVISAHAGVSWLAGGFVGVDVFFVLSGFLITGLLVKEITQTGGLGFAGFYVRRLRRLLPALLAMLLGTGFLASVLLAPGEQLGQATAAATAALWVSNIRFAFEQLDYFSAGTANNLFLHTWSLGVEEQFYLIWPALLTWLLLRKDAVPGSRIGRLKVAMLAIIAVSLLCCVISTYRAPQMAFYMMPLRAWQFATGAWVWLHFNAPAARPVASKSSGGWLGWLGLVLIVAAAVMFGPDMHYPGLRAALPTVGAAAVIAAGISGVSMGASRVLSWRPLQAIGRVSYSWYLWHWPILLLGRAAFPTDTGLYRAGWIALSLLFALASYRWIETPTRNQRGWLTRPRMAIAVSLAFMLVANVVCIRWYNSASDKSLQPEQHRYAQAHVDAPVIYAMGCDEWYHSDKVRVCSFGPADAIHTAVLMGDSVAGQWFPAVAKVFDRPGWRLLVITKSACPMIDRSFFYQRIGREYTECGIWRKAALRKVAKLNPDLVIMGSALAAGFTRTDWIEGTASVLDKISAATGRIYLLRGTPHLPFDGPACLAAHRGQSSWLRATVACQAPSLDRYSEHVYRWLRKASAGFANVAMVDMNSDICPDGICKAERNNVVVFRDSQHLTATFAASLSGALARQIDLTGR